MVRVTEIDWHGRGNRRFDTPELPDLDERPDPRHNPRAVIGSNSGSRELAPVIEVPNPTPLEFAKTTMEMMGRFLDDHPVIELHEEAVAKQAKSHIETARGLLSGLEDERDRKVRPLNEQVAEINGVYKKVTAPLKKVLDDIREKLTDFAKAVENERLRVAEEARRKADEAIAAAREAERLEQEARDNARQGELETGLAQRTVEADAAFADAKKANRQAAVAERETNVKIGGGLGRSMGLRTQIILTLDDPIKAIVAMGGVSDKTREAILSDARAFRKLNGSWPAGVTATTDRSV
jgi:hypothetical protein